MNTKINIQSLLLTLVLSISLAFSSCKKEEDKHTPPDLEFKTGGGYTAADAAAGMNAAILVGVIADKTEDELKTFNVSYAYDGATSTTTFSTDNLDASEEEHYEADVNITTRNQAGTEKWIFTITDRDGNITSKSITLTVN